MKIHVFASRAHDIISYSRLIRQGGPMFYREKALNQCGAVFSMTSGKSECIVTLSRDEYGNDTGTIERISPIQFTHVPRDSGDILISTIGDELDLDRFSQCQNRLFIDLQGFIRVAGRDHHFTFSDKFTCFKCTETEFAHINPRLWETAKENMNIFYIVTHGGKKIELFNKNDCIFTHYETQVDYRDTIGAGDTFFASFVYYFSEGKSIDDSIRLSSVFTQNFLKDKNRQF